MMAHVKEPSVESTCCQYVLALFLIMTSGLQAEEPTLEEKDQAYDLYMEARDYATAGEVQNAAAGITNALKLWPTNQSIKILFCELHIGELGNFDSAIGALSDTSPYTTSPELMFWMARARLGRGESGDAEAAKSILLAIDQPFDWKYADDAEDMLTVIASEPTWGDIGVLAVLLFIVVVVVFAVIQFLKWLPGPLAAILPPAGAVIAIVVMFLVVLARVTVFFDVLEGADFTKFARAIIDLVEVGFEYIGRLFFH